MHDDPTELPAGKRQPESSSEVPCTPRPLVGEAEVDATIARVAASVMAREAVIWNVVQTAIWITTHQPLLVEMVQHGNPIRDNSITEADIDLGMVLLEERPDLWPEQEPPLLGPAIKRLWRACADGQVTMWGLPKGDGPSIPIPVSAWGGLEIRDDQREGIIASPLDRHLPGVVWWSGLTLRREEVETLWSADRAETASSVSSPARAKDAGRATKQAVSEKSTPEDNQKRFDDELRHRIAAKDRGPEGYRDPMVEWAKRELSVTAEEAPALWEHRSAEFPRRAGRHKRS